MKKRMNKKAEGQWGIMFGLILGLLVLLAVGYFMYNFFGTVEGGLETFTPEQIDLKVLSCQGFASSSFSDTFCKFQEIEKATYINCNLPEIKTRLAQEGIDFSEITCATEKEFCVEKKALDVKGKYNDKITVNRLPCYKEGGTAGTDHWDVKSV